MTEVENNEASHNQNQQQTGQQTVQQAGQQTGQQMRQQTGQQTKGLTNRQKGIICVLLEAMGFALMSTGVKLAGSRIPFFEKALFRNLVALLFAFGVMKAHHESFRPKKGNGTGILIRSVFGTIGIFCNFYACGVLLLANANMLNKLAPFFSILFSLFLLHEKPQKVQILGVIVAFTGMLFIVKPGAFQGSDFLPSVIGVIGGASAGFAYTWVRKLGMNGENGTLIVFYFSLFSMCVCVPVAAIHFVVPTVTELMFLILTGTGAMIGQVFVTKAYFFAPAKEISVYDYTQVIFAGIFGYVLFGEVPDAMSITGIILICGAGVAMYLYNNRSAAAAA